ncbi:hypothetical protein ABBQ38_011086 [Trebouxia sp. C0009 RCD-2024]
MFATLVCLGSTSRSWHCCPSIIRWQRASLSFAAQQVQRRASATYRLEKHFCAAAAIHCDEERDTIAALSSGSGRCGVALLRVSGPRADQVLQSLLPATRLLPEPRQAVVSGLYHPLHHELLDRALLLRFPGPRSFTGEDVVELNVHGGLAVVRAVLEALCSMPGVRLAEPGEFTRRAFEMGKLDLTQAEGLADLLTAETEAQRKQALKQSTKAQKLQYESWRALLLRCLANVEAVIDFGEDEGIAEEVAEQVLPKVQQLRQILQQHLVCDRRGELVRSGVKAAIIGPPNVGKSSILNYLAGRKAAIVSAIPGTTRDAIEVALDISGYKVIVTDTAGMRQTLDPIEAEGVAVAHETAEQADVVLSVHDCITWLDVNAAMSGTHQKQDSHSFLTAARDHQSTITVLNKADELNEQQSLQLQNHLQQENHFGVSQQQLWQQQDGSKLPSQAQLQQHSDRQLQSPGLNEQQQQEQQPYHSPQQQGAYGATPSAGLALQHGMTAAGIEARQLPGMQMRTVLCSCKTGWNMDVLVGALERGVQAVMQSGQESGEALVITRARHRQHVEECTSALQRYEDVYMQLELAAEELRVAARALGRVTGVIDTEDLLDAIFSEFCIGK